MRIKKTEQQKNQEEDDHQSLFREEVQQKHFKEQFEQHQKIYGLLSQNAEQATYQDVLRYIEYQRKNHHLSPKTIKHRLYAVKLYFHYLQATGQRQDHPCSELYLKDKVSKQIQVDTLYSTETLHNFLESDQNKDKQHLARRNKVIISLLIYQGLTVQEITSLTLQDIDLNQATINIIKTPSSKSKSPRSRTLPLQARQILMFHHYQTKDREQLLQYNKTNPSEQRFILSQYGSPLHAHSISQLINANKPKAEQLQPIKIRQSVIANLLKRENDIRVVQVFSGHHRASTTQHYQQTKLEQLQAAIQRYHPLR